MNDIRKSAIWLTFGVYACLAGCGGSSNDQTSAGIHGSSTPISVVGPIDGFGSVFVGGIEFETSVARYRVDDEDAFDDGALSVGMIVKIEGTTSGDGTGVAASVYYDDEVEGPVAGLATDPTDDTKKIFNIFGAGVTVSSATTVFRAEDDPGFDFDTLADGDHVEVSGEYHDGMLWATFIKKEDDQDDDFEAKGTVSAYDGNAQFTLILANGSMLAITLAPGAEIPAVGILEDQYVEVEGAIPDPVGAPNAWSVTKVELEDYHDFDDDDHEVKIEGMLSFDGAVWSVGPNPLAFDDNTEYRPTDLENAIADATADGLHVEVRGQYVDGMLLVERVRIEEDDLEIKGFVESYMLDDDPATTDTVTLSFPPAMGTLDVIVDASTMFTDDDSVNQFDPARLSAGMTFVEIRAHLNESGVHVAGVFHVEDEADEYQIEGPLDPNGFVPGVSISVSGVAFNIDPNVIMEDGPPMDGDIVDVEDFDRDGDADSIDVED